MHTAFSAFSAAAELLNLAIDVLVLLVGVQTVQTALNVADRLVKGWLWLAGLVQLTVMLVCTAVAEYGPIVGRYAGRAAGIAYRLGKQARPHIMPVLVAADYSIRRFVEAQAGDTPLADWASPAVVVLYTEPQQLPETRRELLALAKSIALPGYSRMTTEDLKLALA
jgi:hypothetical protein